MKRLSGKSEYSPVPEIFSLKPIAATHASLQLFRFVKFSNMSELLMFHSVKKTTFDLEQHLGHNAFPKCE